MAGLTSFTAICWLLTLFCHHGEACRGSVSPRMQGDTTCAAYRNNKCYITSVGRPEYSAQVCRGDHVRVSHYSGIWPPAWFYGPSAYFGLTRRSHDIKYKFEVKGQTAYGSIAVHIDVLRCRAPDFHTGSFLNGMRFCYSDCEETNVKGAYCQYSCNTGFYLDGPSIVTCVGSSWSASTPPVCRVITCGVPPRVPNGDLYCPGGHTYNKKCDVTCHKGYTLTGSSYSLCLLDKTWTKIGNPCRDIVPPTFPEGCVPTIERIAAPVGEQTVVSWTAPKVRDNNGTPTLKYRLPGFTSSTTNTSAAFEMGTHTVVVFATDNASNTEICLFTVKITVVTCASPKKELNVTHMIYRPDPFGRQPLGTSLSLSCDRGYPQQGAREIQCNIVNSATRQARWTWQGDTVDMRPNCVVQLCPNLTPPQNGALSCFPSTVGTDCLMSCNERYDVPPNVKAVSAGRFTCVNSNPSGWFPTKVADCSEIVRRDHVYVHGDIFYYTGSCNDSLEYLKESFVERMKNNSMLKDACTTACIPHNVQVVCGSTSLYSRKRRSTDAMYIKISFDFVMENSNATTPQEMSATRSRLRTFLKGEISGNGSLVFDGLTTDENSVGLGSVGCQCPSGKICTEDLNCVGCSKGYYMPEGDSECYECPNNTYQETDGATSCVPCPAGTFTESTASYNLSQCQEPTAGRWGDWGMWTECSLSCGGGQQHRQRACDSPVPAIGGKDCQGPDNETRSCGVPFCPVDGGWGQWSSWSVCSATCGGGETTRTRQCDSPATQHGGVQCVGTDREIATCSNVTCPVNGGWENWSDWSVCSASCDGGSQFRDRLCDNPVPSLGGDNCAGAATEVHICNNVSCPECPSFQKPVNAEEPHVIISGKDLNVTVDCLPDYVWAMTYKPQFYCGPQTGHVWSIEPDFAVPFEPPFCSEMVASTGGSGQFNIPMKHDCVDNQVVQTDLKQQVDASLANLPCKNVPNVTVKCTTDVLITCDTPKSNEEISSNGTHIARKRRSAETTEKLTIVVDLNGNIGNNTNMKPGTPAYDQYMAVMRATEESVRLILEKADLLFLLRINGQDVQPDVDKIVANGSYQCPPGSTVRSGFCVKCSAGTFEETNHCFFCPLGKYQDEIGQTECKPCPSGTAWETVGAYRLDQCIHPYEEPQTTKPDPSADDDNSKLTVGVAVGVSVAVVAVAVVVVAAVLYTVKRSKVKKMNSSLLSLNRVYPEQTNRG